MFYDLNEFLVTEYKELCQPDLEKNIVYLQYLYYLSKYISKLLSMYCKTRFLVIKPPITYRLVNRISASFSEISPTCLPLSIKIEVDLRGTITCNHTARRALSMGFYWSHKDSSKYKWRILLTSTSYVEFTAFTCIKSKISVNGLRRNLKDFF